MVHDLIRRLSAEGVGILLVTHDMRDVFALSHRLIGMKNGRPVAACCTADVTEDDVLAMIIADKLAGADLPVRVARSASRQTAWRLPQQAD